MSPAYVAQECPRCGRRVVEVHAVSGTEIVKLKLDVLHPVYVRQPDGEGGAVWAHDTTRELLAAHALACKPKVNP